MDIAPKPTPPRPKPGSASDRGRWHQITNEAAATFLMSDANRRYLRPFLGKEASVSEAAEELSEPVESVYYRVKRMLDLAILVMTRQEARAGRPVKYYRSAGSRIFVPFAVTGAATLEEVTLAGNAQLDERLVRGQAAAMRQAFEDRGTWGYRIFRDEDEGTHFDFAPHDAPEDFDMMQAVLEPTAPPLATAWIEMPLRRDDAKALQKELIELMLRYRAKAADDGEPAVRPYLLRLALAPLLEQGD